MSKNNEINENDFYKQIGLLDSEMLTDLSPDRLKSAFDKIVSFEQKSIEKTRIFLNKLTPYIQKIQTAGIDVALTQPDIEYFKENKITDYANKSLFILNIYDRDYIIVAVDESNFKMSDFIINKYREDQLETSKSTAVCFNLDNKESIETFLGQVLITAGECAAEKSLHELTAPKARLLDPASPHKKKHSTITFQAKK